MFIFIVSACGSDNQSTTSKENNDKNTPTIENPKYSVSFSKLEEGTLDPLGGITCEEGEIVKLPARPGRSTAPITEDYFLEGASDLFPTQATDKVFAGWCDSEPCDSLADLTHYALDEITCPESLSLNALMLEPTTNWESETGGSLVIPNGVTEIAASAFSSSTLTSVVIPDSVTSIGDTAFYKNALTEVVIPDSVTSIVDTVFYKNALTEVVIPDSVTSIGNTTFRDNNLTNITIPDSVTSIGNNAFEENNLTNITIPDSVTIIEYNTFRDNNLTNITIPDSVTSIGDTVFFGNALTEVVIPDSVTSIGFGAFLGNALTSASLPSGVDIGNDGSIPGIRTCYDTDTSECPGTQAAGIYLHDGTSWYLE